MAPRYTTKARVFILSAKDEEATNSMASSLRNYLLSLTQSGEDEDHLLDDLAFTLGQRRSRFPFVSVTSARSLSDLISALETGKMKASRSGTAKPRLGFVFTGQGAQWWAMGRELIDAYPVFRNSLVESEGLLTSFGCPWSLMGEMSYHFRLLKTTKLG